MEKHIIRRSHPQWSLLDQTCFLSKNLYNATLYDRRQHYFATKETKKYTTQNKEFKEQNNPDYIALPRKLSQQIMRQVDRDFTSFYKLWEKKQAGKYDKKVSIPHYLDKQGRNVVQIPKDAIKKHDDEHIIICPKDLGIIIKTKHDDTQAARIVHKGNHIKVEIIKSRTDVEPLEDNQQYAALDFNLDNIAYYSNVDAPRLWNLKPLKSVNQFYNKRKAKLQAELSKNENGEEVYWSKKLSAITHKRNNRLDWELHNISRSIVNHLASNNINTLVVGYNKEWKQDINLGKRNNQSFVGIPFARLIGMLEYKCEEVGITLVKVEESYTSKCSFLDREKVGYHDEYVGKRVKRRLFRAGNGLTLHADVNGAGNILRKVVSDELVYANFDEIVACSTPVMITISKCHEH